MKPRLLKKLSPLWLQSIVAPAIIAGATAFFAASCTTNTAQIQELMAPTDTATVAVFDSELIYTEMGRMKIKVYAPVTRYYQFAEAPFTNFDEGIELNTFDDKMEIESRITAKFAQHRDKQDVWVARNNVVAQNFKGEVLYTEELYWDQKKRIIYTNVNVHIKTQDGHVFGRGLISDDSFSNWEVKEPYDGEIEFDQ